jgi:hypothetical protein
VEQYFEEVVKLLKDDNVVFINYDEVGVFFEMSSDKTLELEGSNHVKLRSSGSDKQRLTLIPCVCSDGNILPPIFIIKSASTKNQNSATYGYGILDSYTAQTLKDKRSLLLVNETAWCNTVCMHDHIYPFLIREAQRLYRNEDKKIVFIFDNFSAHIDDDCLQLIQDAGYCLLISNYIKITGMDYLLLPPNMTGLLQPIDVGIGRSVKSHIKDNFHNWALKNYRKKVSKKGENNQKWTFKNPTTSMIIDWSIAAVEHIKTLDLTKSIINIIFILS